MRYILNTGLRWENSKGVFDSIYTLAGLALVGEGAGVPPMKSSTGSADTCAGIHTNA